MLNTTEQVKLVERMISQAEVALVNGGFTTRRVVGGRGSSDISAIIVRLYRLYALRDALKERSRPGLVLH
jgi:hypothetical protein